jgi:MYXO-CTERM domain-containing protein
VSIYADGDTKTGTLVTRVSAGDKRDDLCTAIGSCNHGFSVALPDEWLDGQTHSLEAYATGDQGGPVKLSGGPKSITCDTPVTGSGGAAGAGGAAGSAGSDTGGTAGSDTGGSAGTSSRGSSGSTSSGKKAGSAGSSSKPTPESGDSGSCSTSSGSSRKDPALALLMVGALFGLRRRRG